MKGVKKIRIDNFGAYPHLLLEFDENGQPLQQVTSYFVNYLLSYLLNTEFVNYKFDEGKTFINDYIYHKPKKTDLNRDDRLVNLYILLELYNKDSNTGKPLPSSYLEIYGYEKDNLNSSPKPAMIHYHISESESYVFKGNNINLLKDSNLSSTLTSKLLEKVALD